MTSIALLRRGRSAAAILVLSFVLIFTFLALVRGGAAANQVMESSPAPRALLVGLHADQVAARPALAPSALAPAGAVQAGERLSIGAGRYDDPVLGVPIALDQIYRLELAPEADMAAVLAEISRRPDVAFVEPDYVAEQIATPNDPLFSQQWGLTKINAPAAWDVQTGGALIAVIDAGFDVDHPDLVGRLWTNPGEIPGNGQDEDSNGRVDDIHGWNFYANNADLSDSTGHGTQVAGLIGATGNNGVGVSGVCWSCQLMVLKVIQPGGTANYSDIATAINYAALKGADVINLSLGGYADSAALRVAVANAAPTVVLVAGAGNDGLATPFYPAAYDGVLAVAGTDSADKRAATSNYGAWVDLSAPGDDVLTTFDGGSYGAAAGTSLAAPFASGAAALLRAEHGWSPALVRAHLEQTAAPIDALNPGYAGLLGRGRLNAGAALTTAPGVRLVAQSVSIDGRAGGQPEPGTTVDLGVLLANQWRPTGPLQATLSSSDPYVTIVTAGATYPAIDTYASAENGAPLRFTVAGSAPYGRVLALQLTLRENGVTIANVPFNVTVANQTVNVSGVISSDTTWSGDRVYRVTGNVIVAEGATLTVEAGARVEVMPGYLIRIQGELLGTGTADAPVVFTSAKAAPAVGDWKGLETTDNGRVELTRCDIGYADIGLQIIDSYGDNGYHIVDGCTIHHNQYGISGIGLVTVRHSQILYNSYFGVDANGYTFVVQDSEIAYNGVGVSGAYQVVRNSIHNNSGEYTYGFSEAGAGVTRSQHVYSNTIIMNQRGIRGPSADNDIQNNNIELNSLYNVKLESSEALTMPNNWWGTTNLNAINATIYDFGEDSDLGIVNVQPILTAPSAAAPAYFYDLDVMPDTTVGLQEVTLDLNFSGPMDESLALNARLEFERRYDSDDITGLTSPQVRDLAIDTDGSVWFASESGILRYSGGAWTVKNDPPFNAGVHAVAVDIRGNKWFSTPTRIVRFDGDTWTVFNMENAGLPSNGANDIAAAADGGVWLAQCQHVTYFDGVQATVYLMEDVVNSSECINKVGVGSAGTVWFQGYTLHRFDGLTWQTFPPPRENPLDPYLYSLAVAGNNVWVADQASLYHYNGSTWTAFTPNTSPIPEAPRGLHLAGDGSLWVGGVRGWAHYDGETWRVGDFKDATDYSSGVSNIATVPGGSIWFATWEGAVQLYDYDLPAEAGHWLDDDTFRATHQVTSLMPRGAYEVEVSGAVAANGRETPPISRPAFTVDYAGEVSDITPPPLPSLTAFGVDGNASAVSAQWSASDPQSAIIAYRYAIGSSQGGREIVDWTHTTATAVERSGLGFVEGQTYWFSVQAQNSGGLWSPTKTRSFVAGQGLGPLYLPMIIKR